jgi:endoglucanase
MSRSTRIPIVSLAVALVAAGVTVVGLAAPAYAAAGCQVTYTTNDWTTSPGQGGFGASITLKNLGDPLTSWTLRFSYPGSQQLQPPGWGATWSQTGQDVTGPSVSWSGNLGTGASVGLGFNGTWVGSNPKPAAFSLNGVACTGTVDPGNQPPAVSITSPASGATFSPPATVTANVAASDVDGSVSRVDFTLGTQTIGDTTAPYSATFGNLASGTYTLTARATDNQGAVGTSSPVTVIVAGGSGSTVAPALHVSGNRLLTASGAAYRLLGVNRSGGEFACIQNKGMWDGPVDQASVTAIRSWKVRAVRIPLNEECWLGTANVPPAGVGGAAYQQNVKDYVNLLIANGITPIVEMHWNWGQYTGTGAGCSDTAAACQKPMPDAQFAPQFWTGVANAFKGNDAVVFDLFNEPYPDAANNFADETAAWRCFRDGGTCTGIGYQVAGFQSLVNAVRATGAANVIMVGGLTWSNTVDQWLQFRPTDPLNNLMAFGHVYNFNGCVTTSCWDGQWAPVAAQVPLVLSEIGQNDCAHGFVDQVMTWADGHGVGYLGWTWNNWPGCGPILITDYTGTPTAQGQGLHDHMALVSN